MDRGDRNGSSIARRVSLGGSLLTLPLLVVAARGPQPRAFADPPDPGPLSPSTPLLLLPPPPWDPGPVPPPDRLELLCAGLPCALDGEDGPPVEYMPTPLLCAGLGCGYNEVPAVPAVGAPAGPPLCIGLSCPGSVLPEPPPGGGASPGTPCLSYLGCDGIPRLPSNPDWGGSPATGGGAGFPGVGGPRAPVPCIGLSCPDGSMPPGRNWSPLPGGEVPGVPGSGAGSCGRDDLLWCGPATPMSTANPVSFETGFKLLGAADISVPLPGRDFVLARSYSSGLIEPQIDGDFPRLLGPGWTLNVCQALHAANANPPVVYIGAGGGSHVFERDGEVWLPMGTSGQRIERSSAVVGGNEFPTWKLVDPGVGEVHYLRRLDIEREEDEGLDAPELGQIGLVQTMSDVYGNLRVFEYARLTESPPGPFRLATIWLNGSSAETCAASVHFEWSTLAESASIGCLRRAIVKRYEGETAVEVAKVVYHYVDTLEEDEIVVHAHVGSPGDLVQVETWQRVDRAPAGAPEGPWHVVVTQYRYHVGGEEPLAIGDYEFVGANHQLKAVLAAEQIEWAAQQANASTSNASVVEYAGGATGLVTLADDAPIFDESETEVLDLASRVVEEYGSGRVVRQYLLSSCGCSGAAQGVRLDYDYSEWTAASRGDIDRSLRIQERIFDTGLDAWSLARTRYYDLASFTQTVDSVPLTFRRLAHDVLEIDDGTPKHWVKRYVYAFDPDSGDPPNVQVAEIWPPAAIASYTPGDEEDPPTVAPRTTGGAYMSYGYTEENRLRLVTLNRIAGSPAQSVLVRNTYHGDKPWLPLRVETPLVEGMTDDDGPLGLDGENNDHLFQTVEYDYGFHDGTDAPRWVETRFEAETVAENGPGGWYRAHALYDATGANTWTRMADNTLVKRTYHAATGALLAVLGNAPDTGIPEDLPELSGNDSWDGRASAGVSLQWSFTYDLEGRMRTMTMPGGSSGRYVRELRPFDHHGASEDGRPGILYYAEVLLPERISASPPSFAGPASVTWRTASGSVVGRSDHLVSDAADHYGDILPGPGYAYGYSLDSDPRSRASIQQDVSGRVTSSTTWHDLEGRGDFGGRYTTTYSYDDEGRLRDEVSPTGSLQRREYDALDRVVEVWQGVAGSSPLLVAAYRYDGATGSALTVGNGLLTSVILQTGESSPATRATTITHDWRDRAVKVEGPAGPHPFVVYDNVDRVVKTASFETLPSGSEPEDIDENRSERIAYAEIVYGRRGFVATTRAAVGPRDNDPQTRGWLETHAWYDAAGRLVAALGPNAPAAKYEYDALGRVVAVNVVDRGGDAAPGAADCFEDACTVTSASIVPNLDDDVVLERTEYAYRADLGLLDLVTHRVRLHDASGTGALGGGSSVTTYTVTEYDQVGRPVREKDFGTNVAAGFESGGSPPTSTGSPPVWSGNVDPVTSETTYDAMGRIEKVSVPLDAGSPPTTVVTRFFHDDMGRRIGTIENHLDGDVEWDATNGRWKATGISAAAPDEDRATTVRFRLDADPPAVDFNVHMMDGSDEVVQTTRYVYGVEAGSSSNPGDSLVSSNDLLAEIRYPERTLSGAGNPSATDRIVAAYNRLGEVRWQKEQRGVEHVYTYDGAGRLVQDLASGGTDVDWWADRILVGYDDAGRLATMETRSGASTVLNGIKLTYNDLGQLEAMFQCPDGPVTESGGTPSGTTKKVVLEYDTVAMGDWDGDTGGNRSRLERMTYPSGHDLDLSYTAVSSGYSLDSVIGRLRTIAFDGADAVHYTFLGLAERVVVDYAVPDIQLDRTFSHDGKRQWASYTDNPGKYPGLDTFGRLRRHAWLDGSLTAGTGSGAGFPTAPPIVELAFEHDRAGNLLKRWDDRPGAVQGRDQEYDLDGLLRLIEARRGDQGSSFVLKPGSERFAYDVVGNLLEFDSDTSGNGAYTDSSDRQRDGSFNMVNELTGLALTAGSTTLNYDLAWTAAGQLRSREVSSTRTLAYTHDAWGRLVSVSSVVGSTSSPRLRQEYNAMNMRTLVDRDAAAGTGSPSGSLTQRRLLYHSPGWQLLEEHVDDASSFDRGDPSDTDRVGQLLWGARYIDDLVMRRWNNNHAGGADTDFVDAGDREGDWALTDAQFSVVALVDSVARVVERVGYDAYGQARHHRALDVDGDGDADAADETIATAALGWHIRQAGYRADADVDRDGTVDSTDVAAFGSAHWQTALLPGLVSAVGNDTGFCGYLFNPLGVDGGLYTVRFRHYDPTPGVARWLERDPAGYMDGPSLYGYGPMAPHMGMDPYGLDWFDDAADFAAGWGDALFLGIPDMIRERAGWNERVDDTSGFYGAGTFVGAAHGLAFAVGGANQIGTGIRLVAPRLSVTAGGALVVTRGGIIILDGYAVGAGAIQLMLGMGATGYGVRWRNASTGESGEFFVFQSRGGGHYRPWDDRHKGRLLQANSHTISNSTLRAIGLPRDKFHQAISAIKREHGQSRAHHRHKIWQNGDVTCSDTGRPLGNIHDYSH